MKKLFFILVFIVFISFPSFSQIYVDRKNINNLEGNFCMFYPRLRKVIVDYGQKINAFSGKNYLTNEQGEPLYFDSDIEIINYFYKNGWDLIQIIHNDSTNSNKYYLKKKCEE